MNATMRTLGIFILLLGLLAAAYFAFEWQKGYFARELRALESEQIVSVDGETIRVTDGIAAETGSKQRADAAVRLAYAVEVVRRSPVVSLPISDTEHLAASIAKLEGVAAALSEIGEEREKEAFNALFPIEFLTKLNDAEKARRHFLSDATEENLSAYLAAAATAIEAREKDTEDFRIHHEELVLDEMPVLATMSGTFSATSTRAFLRDLASDNVALKNTLRSQKKCFDGRARACEDTWLTQNPNDYVDIPDAIPAQVREIQDVRRGANPTLADHVTVALAKSTCTGSIAAPHYFTIWNTDRPFYTYDGDIFFLDLALLKYPVIQYQHDVLGMSYNMVSPFVFYQCPDIARDAGELYAMRAVVMFARKHPNLANAARENLLAPHAIDRSEIDHYVDAILKNSAFDSAEAETLHSLRLALARNNAGIEYVLDDMARTFSTDILHAKAGAPFDLSARVLFATESGAVSLFFAHDPSSIPESFHDSARVSLEEYIEKMHIVQYSDLRGRISRTKLVSHIRNFLAWEGITSRENASH